MVSGVPSGKGGNWDVWELNQYFVKNLSLITEAEERLMQKMSSFSGMGRLKALITVELVILQR